MPRTPRWRASEISDGVGTWELSSWKYFNDFVYQEMLDFRHYVWRGHRCNNWLLEPTLDRVLKRSSITSQLRKMHLDNFKFAVRGRRGPNPAIMNSENERWALGQHYGLATPLLDWTGSPFVAAYFAFIDEGQDQTQQRAIFAVTPDDLKKQSDQIANDYKGDDRPPIVEIVRPFSDDNPRLVNQGGLFTRSPDDLDLESWVRNTFKGVNNSYILIKVTIPNQDRLLALRSLNRMNVNHLSLFPDLYGASHFCNLDLAIDKY